MFPDHGLTVERTKSRMLSFSYLKWLYIGFQDYIKYFVKILHLNAQGTYIATIIYLFVINFLNIVLDIHRSKTY